MILLFPGRHQLLTNFQFQYIADLLSKGEPTKDIDGNIVQTSGVIDALVFAVTSANHSNTRRNPLPFYLRALAIQEFADRFHIPAYIYGIDDVGNLGSFASYTIKRIRHESEGMFDLTPANTLVLCSTPVLEMYKTLGFTILPAELTDRTTWKHSTRLPWDIVETIAGDDRWETNLEVHQYMHSSSFDVWKKYKLASKVQLLFKDRMISEDGDITGTRDYNTYVRQMDTIAELKYTETASYIRPGRIGDIGCAVGSWIKLACRDERLRESDFYGIEVARHLFDICQQRKHNGEFKNPFVFFSQRNAVTGLVFDKESMNTIHTSSLTHEIESYGSRQDLLAFIKNRFEELTHGGVWINRDVVGPENKYTRVLMHLAKNDGIHSDVDKTFSTREELAHHLNGLSTYGRFLRFAKDFRKHEGYTLEYRMRELEGKELVELSLSDACEFMSRKDYTDNWESEMHETFTFWSIEEWKGELEKAGFIVRPESQAYTNAWIVDNRLVGKAELFEEESGALKRLPYPVTNMIVIAEKQ
ncbi:class I SAM-dependent methyltransferase [Ohtaekwangia koreensis]|nr:transferase [Ohtaekwangia koreensis]